MVEASKEYRVAKILEKSKAKEENLIFEEKEQYQDLENKAFANVKVTTEANAANISPYKETLTLEETENSD